MYQIEMEGQAPIKIWASEIDDETLKQLKNIARLPFIFKHVAVMPDVHLGKGATVGSVIASKEAISPAAVGVDIGCGMLAVPLGKTIEQLGDLKKVFRIIEKVVPVGFGKHRDPQEMAILTNTASERVRRVWHSAPYQLGTLGGGKKVAP